MCAFRYVRVATITTCAWLYLRALYKGARFSSEFRLAHFSAHCMELCRFLSVSRLCSASALVSALRRLSSRLPISSLPHLRPSLVDPLHSTKVQILVIFKKTLVVRKWGVLAQNDLWTLTSLGDTVWAKRT